MEAWIEDVADGREERVLIPDKRARCEGYEHEIVGLEEEGDRSDRANGFGEIFGLFRNSREICENHFLVVLVDNHGLWKQEKGADNADACESCLQPEDGAPGSECDNDAAKERSKAGSDEGACVKPGKRSGSLGGLEEVTDDSRSYDEECRSGDGGDHPENEESGDVWC